MSVNSDNVRTFKLVSGEEIILELVDPGRGVTEAEFDGNYHAKNVCVLVPQMDGSTGMMQWLMSSEEDSVVSFDHRSVLTYFIPSKKAIESYCKAFSPIDLPEGGGSILM